MTDINMTPEQYDGLKLYADQAASFVSDRLGGFHPSVAWDVTYADIRSANQSFNMLNKYDVTIKIPVTFFENGYDDGVVISLGHEFVHCLNPNGPPSFQATVLEEGLAEHCGHDFISVLAGKKLVYPITQSVDPNDKYRPAYRLVADVISMMGEDQFYAAIRQMRSDHPDVSFGRITADILTGYLPVESATVLALSTRFADWEP